MAQLEVRRESSKKNGWQPDWFPFIKPVRTRYPHPSKEVTGTGFVYAQVILLSLGVYVSSVLLLNILFLNNLFALTWPINLAGVLILVSLVGQMTAWAQRTVDLSLQRNRANYRRALEIFDRQTKDITDLRLLALTVEQAITLATGAEDVRLLLLTDNGFQFAPVSERTSEDCPPIRLMSSSPIVTWMRFHEDALRRENLETGSLDMDLSAQEYADLDNCRIQLLIPVKYREELAGILTLAKKRSAETYSEEDLRLLQGAVSHTAMWIANARLIAGAYSQQARLEQLLERSIRAQEDERKRLAMELHDSPVQWLTSAAYHLEACMELFRKGYQHLTRVELEEAQRSLDRTLEELRYTSAALHPSQLEKVGLTKALARCGDAFEQDTGIITSFQDTEQVPRFLDPVELAVYRVVQEALSNVRKHSRATEVQLRIGLHNGAFWATIRDNGVGFVTDNNHINENQHLGLAGMEERAHMLGGTLGIQSTPEVGTQITLLIPNVETVSTLDKDDAIIGAHRQ